MAYQPPRDREVKVDELLKTNPEFRLLHKEHQTLEMKIGEMTRQKYLTPEQEIERKKMQKQKLHGKDRMEQILREAQI